jgi:hypothetical protein
MKRLALVFVSLLAVPLLFAQSASHLPVGIVSDWTSHHLLFPHPNDASVMARMQRDPRWLHNWYLRHRELWWPEPVTHRPNRSHRDWSVPLGSAGFGPSFDFSFDVSPETGYGSLTTTDQGNSEFLATNGSVTITAGADAGTYPLYPGGPGVSTSPLVAFLYDDLIYFGSNPPLDVDGLLFTAGGLEVNIWGNSPGNYSFYDYSNGGYGTQLTENGTFTEQMDPGGGETYPAKYVFDVTQAPSCANDYVVLGLPMTPASGGQANIIGVNNLYSGGVGALCSTGPSVEFGYASGTGEVPAAVTISQNGTQVAYIENLTTGSSYFHVLTIGTTGNNGTSATAAAVPGSGNNAVDQRVLLSPDAGITHQSSTNAAWVAYTADDVNDFAFATTYSSAGTGSGYLYKITNVFNGSAPTIVWSVPINGMPSTPVYDTVSNKVFFTDSNGRIDYVVNSATAPAVVYGSVLGSGATSENAVVVDSGNQMVYATFNSNGTNALVVQSPTTLASSVSVPIGTAGTVYASPFQPDFNNAFYTGSGTPLLYIAGTGTGTLPTLYSIGFDSSGVLNSAANTTTVALATGMADSSPVTEFYNSTLGKDYLFVGVTNNCVASVEGGTGGCVMSLDITNGFPAVNATTTALAASGGTSGIVVDNDSTATQASSIYYATSTGATLVKATQAALQ